MKKNMLFILGLLFTSGFLCGAEVADKGEEKTDSTKVTLRLFDSRQFSGGKAVDLRSAIAPYVVCGDGKYRSTVDELQEAMKEAQKNPIAGMANFVTCTYDRAGVQAVIEGVIEDARASYGS